jgi:hypothetical protein
MNPLARTLRTIAAGTYEDFPSGPLSRRCFGAVFSAAGRRIADVARHKDRLPPRLFDPVLRLVGADLE